MDLRCFDGVQQKIFFPTKGKMVSWGLQKWCMLGSGEDGNINCSPYFGLTIAIQRFVSYVNHGVVLWG